MDKNLIHQNKKYDEADEAFKLACCFFEESHPRESWPEWLEKCIGIRATKIKKRIG